MTVLRCVVVSQSGRRIEQYSQQIALDVSDVAGVLAHALMHILDMQACDTFQTLVHKKRRLFFTRYHECGAFGAKHFYHQRNQFIQPLTVILINQRIIADAVMDFILDLQWIFATF